MSKLLTHRISEHLHEYRDQALTAREIAYALDITPQIAANALRILYRLKQVRVSTRLTETQTPRGTRVDSVVTYQHR